MMESIGTEAAAIEVLLVEDSAGDVRLTREAFKDAKVHINLHVASDGIDAMAFLGRGGDHANVPRPVLFLPTYASDADILRSYRLHANCYITKPVDLDGFLKVVKSIDSFWLSVVKLPQQRRDE